MSGFGPEKTCATCKKTFPRDIRGFFHRDGETRRADCSDCRNDKRRGVPRDKEKAKAYSKKYRAKIKALVKAARDAQAKGLIP